MPPCHSRGQTKMTFKCKIFGLPWRLGWKLITWILKLRAPREPVWHSYVVSHHFRPRLWQISPPQCSSSTNKEAQELSSVWSGVQSLEWIYLPLDTPHSSVPETFRTPMQIASGDASPYLHHEEGPSQMDFWSSGLGFWYGTLQTLTSELWGFHFNYPIQYCLLDLKYCDLSLRSVRLAILALSAILFVEGQPSPFFLKFWWYSKVWPRCPIFWAS